MRKLATAAAVSLALASGGAFGLGLGDIEMRSALNQPMNAEIRLTSVKTGELEGMIVQLASAEAFERAGIERSTVLTDLRFSVDQSSGVPVIRISSQRPVVEPFLNFLLEVDWPQGRMVREYTVLLDPPVFMTPTATERNTTSDQPALVDRGTEALVVPTPIERNEGFEVDLGGLAEAPADSQSASDVGEIVLLEVMPDVELMSGDEAVSGSNGEIVALTDLGAPNQDALEQREQEASAADDFNVELIGAGEEVSDTTVIGETGNGGGEDGSTIVSLEDLSPAEAPQTAARQSAEVTVGSGDTLFEIAKSNSAAGVSVQQMMMALLAANESSFINKNINLVRAGSILRVPDTDEATRLTQRQAMSAIGQQNQLWQEYRDQLLGSGSTRLASGDTNVTPAGTVTAPSDTAAIDTAALDPELSSEDSVDGLSAEARAILDNARSEILDREELRLVADDAPTSTTASATADETTDNDATRLGELNRKLQLAREELSSTRVQSDELTEQAGELKGTTDNLDSLISLRQNEISQLETQLADAREAAAIAEAEAAEAEVIAAAEAGEAEAIAEAKAAAEAEAEAKAAAQLAANAGDTVVEAGQDVVTAVGDAGADAVAEVEEIADSGVNALTEAGETLGDVELIDENATADTDTEEALIPPPRKQTTWYQDFMSDPKRMAIAGVGAVGLLGVLGTLLFRRKRRDDDLLDIGDELEFANDEDAAGIPADKAAKSGNGVGLAAGAAAVGATAIAGSDREEKQDNAFDDLTVPAIPLGSDLQTGNEVLNKDDTISEVEVYLAYGLHGQAEELLAKATERDPNNEEYAQKLLQTYHAQGNADSFQATASNFHARFGGEENPAWPAIAVMGAELRPNDALFASGREAVSRIGAGHSDGSAMGDEDFLPAQDYDTGSINRGFDSASDSVDFDSADESELMEQSLDPAFAFDEGDLEATGDFSELASEVANEKKNSSIEFSDFDATGGDVSLGGLTGEDLLDMPGDLTNELSADLTEGEGLSLDELDNVASVNDLTLDLDQLSGDLELDSSELMNADLSDLDLPDLSVDNDMFDENVGMGDNADEMDTMLDLAKAYIDMGDKDSASSALDEIVKSGNPAQVTEAETLLRKIS
ncbi:FimV/HubP family polar landmark protein [Granulosicoccus antarcticus]|uniref:LysM domain-containing protein n=1 Tax=Granulosicoccus antarcticus IMCC3135 TaxID=1192854 RepID=A0A2Z2NV35_9GAMM|nr:FimV/HubP family polar landmark protein [Granulosicoccus antarcticus]ASJ75336.1 hypothetical protein IMCC3135_26405 [Granulosicoccus antarcticus IMCC3135]